MSTTAPPGPPQSQTGSLLPDRGPSLSLLALTALLVGAACSSPPAPPPAGPIGPEPSLDDDDAAVETTPVLGADPNGSDLPTVGELEGLEALACAGGTVGCAADGPFIEGTCCSVGDNLEHLATATAAEAVDVEFDGDHVFACGGFGVRISDVSEPASPDFLGSASSRCQRIGIGPRTGSTQIFWLAHHGDSWVPEPSLQTWRLDQFDDLHHVDTLSEPGVRYEGLLFHDGVLYAAAHDGGLRIYSIDDEGQPTLQHVVGGFDNAQKIAAVGATLYITDDDDLLVVDASIPATASVVAEVAVTGSPRDVAASTDRVFVALGARGVDVFDVVDGQLVAAGNLPTMGSSQAVDVNDELLAIADWSHVSIHDADTLIRLGGERNTPYPHFEQDLGVALGLDRTLFVAEWEAVHVLGYRPGYVAPDIHVEGDLFSFPSEEELTRQVRVHNRGPLTLHVESIAVSDPAFAVSHAELSVPPATSTTFDLTYTPPPPDSSIHSIAIRSDDPDPHQDLLQLPLHAVDTGAFDVGDSILVEEFAFLDPTGQGDVANLQGHVLVLAYFALF
jgi:hypothetical protein